MQVGRNLVFGTLALMLVAAAMGCGNILGIGVAVYACNGDPAEKVTVAVELYNNEAQQTLPPGVCVTVAAFPEDVGEDEVALDYEIWFADEATYRAEMSALRDRLRGIVDVEISDPKLAAQQMLLTQERIAEITRTEGRQACSGRVGLGQSVRVPIVRDASGVWVCGQKELTTPEPRPT